MSLRKIDDAALNSWVDGLVAAGKVIGIQAQDDRFAFGELTSASQLRLDYDVALTSPGKQYLQPPKEVLLRFEGARYESVLEQEPFVLFGVHPYDVVAIRQMDKIFALDESDVHYLARREAATIVACDVQTPSENVFAGCMGTAVVNDGFDVLLTRIGDAYMVEARTAKGEALTCALADAPEPAGADMAARLGVWEENRRLLRKHQLAIPPSDLPFVLDRGPDHPVWQEKAELCFSCGSCNTVCPTCYCFDVQDDVHWDLNSGERTRQWDGCLLEKFARVAGGHNFRPERHERYRHRYYRKGKYVPEKIGECACVGCGRCITACVAKIANPVEVFNRLLEDE